MTTYVSDKFVNQHLVKLGTLYKPTILEEILKKIKYKSINFLNYI